MAAQQEVLPGMPKQPQAIEKYEQQPVIGIVLQMAIQQGASIEHLAKLLEIQERYEANEARKAYNAAVAKFKEHPPQINKNKHVEFGNTKYDHATLDHVVDQITQALSRVGISHRWDVAQNDKDIAVTCILTHELGHSERTTLRATADTSGSKNSIQAIGSAVTYLQRYTLLLACGMAAKGQDNDGNFQGMSEEAVNEYLETIRQASSRQELQARFQTAYKAAESIKDKAAQQRFIDAKSARFKEVR